MAGIIISDLNYTYKGTILHDRPHGHGIFEYANGDKYVGSCKYGKLDGYGTYVFSGIANDDRSEESASSNGFIPIYTGFFSYGRMDGVGTYEDDINIYKGTWRRDKKHGSFYKTHKPTNTTYIQLWLNNRLLKSEKTQYIRPEALKTTKENPLTKPKKHQIAYKGTERKCIACFDKFASATNAACGHVALCFGCLSKCNRCPICRADISQIVKLYIS